MKIFSPTGIQKFTPRCPRKTRGKRKFRGVPDSQPDSITIFQAAPLPLSNFKGNLISSARLTVFRRDLEISARMTGRGASSARVTTP